jgi:hypothetical protein
MDIESASGVSAAAEQFSETLHKVIVDSVYTDEHLYNCDETAGHYKLFLKKSLSLKKSPRKAGMKMNNKKRLCSCVLIRLVIAS